MIAFALNLPFTLIGLFMALVLRPYSCTWSSERTALILRVRGTHLPFILPKGWRGFALGHTVVLNPREEANDLEHELIHVDQHRRLPVLQPFIYELELLRKGYKQNRFEIEAYAKSGSVYREG